MRPRACRTYPLGVNPDDTKPGAWINHIVSKSPRHFTGTRRRVGDWVDETMTPEDRAFVGADYLYSVKLARLIRRIDSRQEERVLSLILYFKYTAYDTAEDFQPQYIRNMERLIGQLERLGSGA